MAAARLEDFDGAATLFSVKDVAQDDNVVGEEFFQAMSRDFSIFTIAFRRHKHGEAGLFEGAADMKQLAAQDLRVADEMVKKLGE